MSVHYFDPSAWAKRHFQEEGSHAVKALFRADATQACCHLGIVEMVAAIARKSRSEPLDPAVTKALLADVNADFAAFRVVRADDDRAAEAVQLALRHRLRAMDALHLACALWLRIEDEVVMVSADLELLAAASQEGLETVNPASSRGSVPR